MKYSYLLVFVLLFVCSATLQAQENIGHTWSKMLFNSSPAGSVVDGRNVKADAAGNTYVTGYFSATADFDPGAGTVNLTSTGLQDIFFAKYNAAGNLVYAKSVGGSGLDLGIHLVVDASGHVYITGVFSASADFDPGAGTVLLTSAGGQDVFIAKYDAAGNLVFAKGFGGTADDESSGLGLDAAGNVYVTGRFNGSADFDPGAGTVNLSSAGSADIFLAKYDTNGNYVFAKKMGGTSSEIGQNLAIDAANNIYVTGTYGGTVDFDPGAGTANLTSLASNDAFFAKYSSNGDYVYAKRIGGASPNNVNGYGIAVDAGSNVFISGNYAGTVDFDPGAGTVNLTAVGSNDIFFGKYDSNGDYVYAKSVGGVSVETGYTITVDGSGNVYVSGFYSGTIDLDPGAGTSNFTSAGSNDVFFAKYDAAGGYVYGKSIGGTNVDRAYSHSTDNSGKIYLTGTFRNTVDFDPGAGTVNLTAGDPVANSYIAGYDAGGNYIFAGLQGGYASTGFPEESKSVAVDGSGNVYITGYFRGTVDFDPGAGTANLTSAGGDDIYFAKYDASGNFIYAKAMGSTSSESGNSIVVDGSGNAYITGVFQGTVDFDPGAGAANLTSAGGDDVFVAKYDASGNYVFALRMGGTLTDEGISLRVDGSGNVYVGGFFYGTADFDPGAGVVNLASTGNNDFFIAKYDALGNYVFAKAIGNSGVDFLAGLAIDGSGNIYTTGYFQNTVDFDPGAGTVNLTATGAVDLFLAKYDASGNYVYAKRAGGTGSIVANSIAVDGSGNAYITGSFNSTIDFDPGGGTVNLVSTSSNDIFIAKYDASGNYVYAKQTGATSSNDGKAIAVDGSGNVYATGYFAGTADFDPGAGTANLISAGNNDIFLVKYDASGNYVYAKAMGGINSDVAYGLALDNSGNVLLTGNILAAVDFDPGAGTTNLIANNSFDVFIAKYSACALPVVAETTVNANPAAISGATSLTDGGCRLLAVVEPNGATPVSGTINAQVWIESSVPTYAGQPFVARHYQITPVTNASIATGRVTFYFTQQEFDDFNNHPGSALNLPTGAGDAAGIGNLLVGKYEGTSSNGTGLPDSYSGTAVLLDPVDSDIVWNASLSRWEVSMNVEGFSGFILQTSATTLPVSLTAFTVKKNGHQSLLNWSTSSEQNNKGFVVERSNNGRIYNAIGFVQAANSGNNSTTNVYNFTDAAPLKGRNYYRLQQQDVNGAVTFSEVRLLNFGTVLAGVLYPNPVSNTLYLQLEPAQPQTLHLRLSDLQGRTLRTWTLKDASGLLQLPLNGLASGNYQLELINENGEREVHRLLKQ